MSNTEYIEKEDKILEDQLDETVIDEVVESVPEEIVEKKSGDIAKVPLYTNKFVEAMNVIAWIELIASAIMAIYIWLTLPTAKAGGFLFLPLLHRLIPNNIYVVSGIATSYTVSTS